MSFEPWQWVILLVGAAAWGASKTGLPGVGILFVAVFADLLPARQATGVVLPLLLFADLLALVWYRRHLEWRRVGRLLPWTLAGIVTGWAALGMVNDGQMARVVGGIVAGLVVVQAWRERGGAEAVAARAPAWLGPVAGVLAGFTTMVANAAGPVMILYLLAMRLPKWEFLGTSAAFFLVINWIKVPFVLQLGLINRASLGLNVGLLPAVAVGAWLGHAVAARIDQRTFERVALGFTLVAAGKLLFF